jgi:hypothetical protein
LGHKHKRWAIETEPEEGLTNAGNLYTRKRWAIMTGCYGKVSGETDATKDGYRINFGEERMRSKQRTGGIHACLYVNIDEIDAEFIV